MSSAIHNATIRRTPSKRLLHRIVRRHLWGLVQCDRDCTCGENSGLWFVEDYRNPNIEPWMNCIDTEDLWNHIVHRGWHLPPNE